MNNKPYDESRRRFIKQGAFLGSTLLASILAGDKGAEAVENSVLKSKRPDSPYGLMDPENIIYSTCLNCNTGCGIKCKIQDGVLTKVDGNPYNPFTMYPHLPMTTTLQDASKVDGGLCPKGQAGVQSCYDPYRLRKVLKRKGKRGENKWETISFAQAIKEVVEGGKLFSHVSGEENRHVEGLRSIMALKDYKVAKSMGGDVKKIWKEKDKNKKQQLVEKFKKDHAKYLDTLIDPNHPDLGPKNNQFVLAWGRLKGGRKEFIKRLGYGFGTTNMHGHTTVCQGSIYFTCKAMSEQYDKGKFAGGKKFYWQTDTENARYILFVGSNLFEANYGPTNRTVRLSENLTTGHTKIAVVDPRYSKLASKAHKWLPIKPGEDAALGMAIIQWIIKNNRYDSKFLRSANKAAAEKNGEPSYSNGAWLIEIKDGKPGKFVRAADLGLAEAEERGSGDDKYTEKFLLVMKNAKPVAFDPNDKKKAVEGDLFVDSKITPVNGGKPVHVKSALQLLKEEADQKSFDQWCQIAGLKSEDVLEVSKELASYGKRASVDCHRGVTQHTNGFYNVMALMSINLLLGNFDWKGGMCKANKYAYDGSKGGVFDLTHVPGKIKGFGVSSIRHGVNYEDTSLFEGYPAKRNWYPLASDIYEEIIPSMNDEYPYPIKALFLYKGTPVYALPAGHTNIDVLADVKKLPLYFASDITVGTSTMYCDYIFPDLSYMERWEFQGSHPNMPNKLGPIRQPVVGPIPGEVTVYGEKVPISLESTLMAIAEKMGLKAFGKNGLGDGIDFNRPEDFYVRAIANIAAGEKDNLKDAVPDADAREMEIFTKSRRHLPKSVFDEAKWRKLVGDKMWPKTVYLLNRGGRFEEHEKAFKGDHLAHKYGKLINLYQEKTAGKIYSGTGKHYPGIAKYLPQTNYVGKRLDKLSEGYDLHLITNRTITATKSRTIGNYWLQPIMPENKISINPIDARKFGLSNGSRAKIVSSTNQKGEWDFKNGRKKSMTGTIKVTETMMPGVVSFELGWGHWATGAEDIVVDGQVIKGDSRRATGVHANAAMWTDPSLRNNTCLVDPVGASVSFYDTKINLVKV